MADGRTYEVPVEYVESAGAEDGTTDENNGENGRDLDGNSVTSRYGNGFEQNNDTTAPQQGEDTVQPVAADAASGVEGDRDRGAIRGYEEGLANQHYDNSEYGERDRREAESERLVGIAKQNGQYYDRERKAALGTRNPKGTGESEVYINDNQGVVYKVKDPYAKSPMKGNVQPEDAIYEHLVHNKYFPETGYGFVGISDELGDARIILSQDYVGSVGQPTKEQIEAALAEKGLVPEGNYRYGNDEISVTDVTGDNALLGADGKVYFIDPIIDFKKPVREILSESVAETSAAEATEPGENGAQGVLSRIPVDEQGEPMFEAVDKDTAWDGLVEAAGSEPNAVSIATAQARQASDALEALKKKQPTRKVPKLEGSPMAMAKAMNDAERLYQEKLSLYNEQVSEAQARLKAWNDILGVNASRNAELLRRQEEAEAIADMLDDAMAEDYETINRNNDERGTDEGVSGGTEVLSGARADEPERDGPDTPRQGGEEAVGGGAGAEAGRGEGLTEAEPSEAQKAAGNYRMGHRRIDGYNISIENRKGSVRRGTGADGKRWETVMQNDYGYIRGTEGVDGDHIDVFLSDTPEEGDVFVVDQVNEDGSFDEHKVMYGFPTEEAAREAYLSNYEPGWKGLGAITHVSKEEFKKWVESSRRKTKPFAEYAGVKVVCPVCGKVGIPNYHTRDVVCPQCNSDLSVFRQIDQLTEDEKQDLSDKFKGEDNQGNPIDHAGKLIVDDVKSIDDISDEDFIHPTRTIGLPKLPDIVSDAIGANDKRVIIKKNIFGKNHKNHKELTPAESREILRTALYTPTLYGQNKKNTRPCNWILIHLADKNTCVLIEVDNTKENCEIVNWHYLREETLKQKERQAKREGGRILTLSENNAAGDTSQGLSSDGKGSSPSAKKQAEGEKSSGDGMRLDAPSPNRRRYVRA